MTKLPAYPHYDTHGLPFVRLSKDEKRALCADIPCGEPLAERVEATPIPDDELPLKYELEFGPGWLRGPEGVWVMSSRVRKRMSSGRSPGFRRRPDGAGREAPADPRAFRALSMRWPVVLICPACNRVQIADVDVLKLR